MLTARILYSDGRERVTEIKEMHVVLISRNNDVEIIGEGEVYVMNAHGSTVASYQAKPLEKPQA